MTILSSDALQIIMDQLTALKAKRDGLENEIMEIDSKISAIARQLGVELPAASGSSAPRLPRPSADKRSVGTLPEAMMKALFEADRGYTRVELKRVMREGPMGEAIRKNENTFYNAVKRYLDNDKIVEIDGLIYHPERAPLETDPNDQERLPTNVTLFTGKVGDA